MIADYLFGELATDAGSRIAFIPMSESLTKETVDSLIGITIADVRSISSVLAVGISDTDAGRFFVSNTRAKESAYGRVYKLAVDLPKTVFLRAFRSGAISSSILALVSGSDDTSTVTRAIGFTSEEVTFTRTLLSADDSADFESSITQYGILGEIVNTISENITVTVAVLSSATSVAATDGSISSSAEYGSGATSTAASSASVTGSVTNI